MKAQLYSYLRDNRNFIPFALSSHYQSFRSYGGRALALTETFGANLRHQRKAKNLTQGQLAERVGVSTEMVSKIERGIAAPSFTTIEKLADELGVPEVVFFGIGLIAVADSERSKALQKIQTVLSRMNSDQLVRAHKMLSALID